MADLLGEVLAESFHFALNRGGVGELLKAGMGMSQGQVSRGAGPMAQQVTLWSREDSRHELRHKPQSAIPSTFYIPWSVRSRQATKKRLKGSQVAGRRAAGRATGPAPARTEPPLAMMPIGSRDSSLLPSRCGAV